MFARGNVVVGCLLACALAALPSIARAEPDVAVSVEVDKHLARGLELYQDGAYEAALVEFRAGFALEARPELLFALAQAERKSGDCASALVYYRRFIETGPPVEQAAAAQLQLEHCGEALGSAPDVDIDEALLVVPPPEIVEPGPEPEPGPPAVAMQPIVTEPPRRDAWYRDRFGVVLLSGGAVATLVGLGLLVSARGAAGDADDATTYDDYDRAVAAVEQRQLLGALVTGGGVVVLGVAAVRLIVKRRTTAPRRTVEVGVVHGGVSLTWQGRF
jgi:tetratricopeptide (TPR) repeat protein